MYAVDRPVLEPADTHLLAQALVFHHDTLREDHTEIAGSQDTRGRPRRYTGATVSRWWMNQSDMELPSTNAGLEEYSHEEDSPQYHQNQYHEAENCLGCVGHLGGCGLSSFHR